MHEAARLATCPPVLVVGNIHFRICLCRSVVEASALCGVFLMYYAFECATQRVSTKNSLREAEVHRPKPTRLFSCTFRKALVKSTQRLLSHPTSLPPHTSSHPLHPRSPPPPDICSHFGSNKVVSTGKGSGRGKSKSKKLSLETYMCCGKEGHKKTDCKVKTATCSNCGKVDDMRVVCRNTNAHAIEKNADEPKPEVTVETV